MMTDPEIPLPIAPLRWLAAFCWIVIVAWGGLLWAADAAPKGTKDVTFDDVKLEMKKGDAYDDSLLTAKVKQLDGKSIRIRGFILPSFKSNGLTQFVLVRDNMECCFGPGALLHDCILVEMIAPATATFTVRPVSVEGVFSIHPYRDPDGNCMAIYHLDGKEVK